VSGHAGHTHGYDHDHGHDHAASNGPPQSLAALRESDDYTLRSLRVAANGTPWRSTASDPTGTKTIRDRYEGEMYRRFRALKGAIVETVAERDAFGLVEGRVRGDRPTTGNAAPRRLSRLAANDDGVATALGFESAADARGAFRALASIDIDPAGPNEFDFPSDGDKVDGFVEWLDRQADRGILERGRHSGRDITAANSWQEVYIRSSYERGVNHADAAAVDAGIIPPEQTLDDVFRATRHADGAGLLYTRAFRELDGVTSAMAQDMTRELTEGFTQGENPRRIARRLNDRVDSVGLNRGRVIARTETIRAHNEAGINRYEDMGERIGGVAVVAEHTTAGDPCPICAGLNGTRYKPKNARGRIPVHPNCRCSFVPIQVRN